MNLRAIWTVYKFSPQFKTQHRFNQNSSKDKGPLLSKECLTNPDLPKVLVICGPSAVGKSTLLALLIQDFSKYLEFCVSHTTRQARPGEKHGVHYYFLTQKEMMEGIKKGYYLKPIKYGGFLYGTNRKAIEKISQKGKIALMDINVIGVETLKNSKNYCGWYVFLLPPSLLHLEERMRNRSTETEETMNKRLATATVEIKYGLTKGNFDKVILNDSLHNAYSQLKKFVVLHVITQLGRYPIVSEHQSKEKT